MKPANIIYFGSPDFSAEILQSLLSPPKIGGESRTRERGVSGNVRVVGVVTSPDAPLGRKQIITPSPVAVTAARYDLPIFKSEKLDDAHLSHLKLLKPDIFLVVSYGKIIPSSYLTTPTIGTFNIHFSLLPKYRGALPISEAIKNGDTQTGVTLMVMDGALDHGPVISAQEVTIDINDNVADLTTKLTQAAIALLTTQLPLITTNNDQLRSSPQDDSLATHTPSLKTRTRQSAFIPWETINNAMTAGSWQLAADLHNLIRSLNPDPGAWTRTRQMANGKWQIVETKIIKTELKKNPIGHMLLAISQVQLPGKSPISWDKFLSGHHIV